MRRWDLKILMDHVPVYLIVYIISHSNRCEPDAKTSDQGKTVIMKLFKDQNGLGMVISNVTREREKECEWAKKEDELNKLYFKPYLKAHI